MPALQWLCPGGAEKSDCWKCLTVSIICIFDSVGISVTGVGFYEWLCVCVSVEVNGCCLALMTVICIMDSQAILTVKDRDERRGKNKGRGQKNASFKESRDQGKFRRAAVWSKSDLIRLFKSSNFTKLGCTVGAERLFRPLSAKPAILFHVCLPRPFSQQTFSLIKHGCN